MARSGKTALVTGASAGLGLHFARVFARDGHDLVLVARRQDRLDQLATELSQAYGTRSTVIAADLTDPKTPLSIHEQLIRAGIEVDFLVNNAGFGNNGAFADHDLTRELDAVELNVKALTHLTGLVLPAMLARGSGRILNVASLAGFLPGPFMATYYASKAYVLSFTEALAYELRGSGITVTALCPGPDGDGIRAGGRCREDAVVPQRRGRGRSRALRLPVDAARPDHRDSRREEQVRRAGPPDEPTQGTAHSR